MTKLVGIVNVTPDSFSDGGAYQANEKIAELIKYGADIIDIGAESTRPNAVLLSPEEEWQRLEPVIKNIDFASYSNEALGQLSEATSDQVGAQPALCMNAIKNPCWSFDTRHIETAQKLIASSKSQIFINDISCNEKMYELAQEYGCKVIFTHTLSIPANPKITLPENVDAVEELYNWAARLLEKHPNIIIDVGIGFGKTAQQSLSIIKNISRIKSLGAEIMVGHSRKSFLSLFCHKPAKERDPETLVISSYLIGQKVDYLRVHDVRSHASLLKIKSLF